MVCMERTTFAERLHLAARRAHDFARTLVEEPLPDPLLFRLAPAPGAELQNCTVDQALDVLWRDGQVPEWIDVAVVGESGSATLVELLCCGRFIAGEERLYHAPEGHPPFHVLGPSRPARYESGQRFSIYHRVQCATRGDLERLAPHARKVWSLDLVGRDFDDATLAALPPMPALELLELRQSPIAGHGLAVLAQLRRLRTLRLQLAPGSAFCAPELEPIHGLDWLQITDPPTTPWGSRALLEAVPQLGTLWLEADGDLFIEGPCPALQPTPLGGVSLRATRLTGDFSLPPILPSLYAHLRDANDADLERLLEGVRRLDNLDLSETPVSARLVERLLARHPLRHLNVSRTRVDVDAVRRIRAAYPTLKLLPQPPA
jgi:hypothetical protein